MHSREIPSSSGFCVYENPTALREEIEQSLT